VDRLGREVQGTELREFFYNEYLRRTDPWSLVSYETGSTSETVHCNAVVLYATVSREVSGTGTGTLAAFVNGIQSAGGPNFEITSYHEHALGTGTGATAIAYVKLQLADGRAVWGASEDPSIGRAGVKAVLSALNRAGATRE
jgi:2-isopropylmalate synthase